MLFAYLTLATALVISLSAAVYSILGLTAIFAAAFWPIVVMGGSLEVGKIVATLWLHKYWKKAEIQYKAYLCVAVAILMMLTSMGVFGFLSKAHGDQSLVSGDSSAKVAIFDEKIKISRENIDANRRALKQMDEAVDQVMARSTTEGGADKAVAIRRGQQAERGRLLKEIEAEQKKITALNEERAPLAAENRKIEAEVGPVKYIAALIYGDNPEENVLEKAVRWVIILIVIVFDPLALTLLLAATKSIEWERGIDIFNLNKRKEDDEAQEEAKDILDEVEPENKPETKVFVDGHGDIREVVEPEGDEPVFDREEIPLEEEVIDEPKKRWAGYGFPMGSLFTKREEPKEEPVAEVVEEPVPVVRQDPHAEDPISQLARTFWHVENPTDDPNAHHDAHDAGEIDTLPWHNPDHINNLPISDGEKKQLLLAAQLAAEQRAIAAQQATVDQANLGLQADNEPTGIQGDVKGFGIDFPKTAVKGDMFLRVDRLPSALYKFNGSTWIEVDKALSDNHSYDSSYIDYLINKISTGEYDPDLLSDAERDAIEKRLT